MGPAETPLSLELGSLKTGPRACLPHSTVTHGPAMDSPFLWGLVLLSLLSLWEDTQQCCQRPQVGWLVPLVREGLLTLIASCLPDSWMMESSPRVL